MHLRADIARLWLTILACTSFVLASVGDRSEFFQSCIPACLDHFKGRCDIPLLFRLARWTCDDECKYQCMRFLTDNAVKQQEPIVQYYGKWPFVRYAGMQEPASVAFSVLNLIVHVQGARIVSKKVPQDHPMRPYCLAWSYISINAWFWSSVFHTRDTPWTEKLDYFSAASTIMYALYSTAVRVFHLYASSGSGPTSPTSPSQSSSTPHRGLRPWAITCLITYIGHVTYLSVLPRFDYAYNMAFNLILGLTHNVLWIIYSLPSSRSLLPRFPFRPKAYRPAFVSKAFAFVLFTTAATALELLDFPPWMFIIDAHALWHLSTVPITKFWYDFLVEDALDEGWKLQKG